MIRQKHHTESEEKQMLGLGTIINSAAVIAGGAIGHFTGKLFKPQQQESLNKVAEYAPSL